MKKSGDEEECCFTVGYHTFTENKAKSESTLASKNLNGMLGSGFGLCENIVWVSSF